LKLFAWSAVVVSVLLAAVACGDGAEVTPATATGAASAATSPPTTSASIDEGPLAQLDSSGPIPPSVVAPPTPVTLVAVGDLMLGRTVGARLLSDGPGIVFDDQIAAVLAGADITVGNLECAVSEGGTPQAKGYTFRAPPPAVDALALGGFDVVSLANNHSLDYGATALSDTASALRGSGIQPVGAGENLATAQSPVIVERGGLRIAFVALVDVPAEGEGFSRETWEARADRPGVAWADQNTVTSVVSQAALSADIVVVMLHFGLEYHADPSASQRELAHAAIAAGAALVVGSHPHLLQEVEEYGGGLIAYSLGNFVFDGFGGASNDSAILRVTFSGNRLNSWELVPVDIVDNGLPRLRRP
jgi:poly-gamma-glutamate synthesis protein (capsule biosynthesis protein)